jgi:hypothetical protein
MAWAICSLDSGCLHLLPASGLADGSSPLRSDGRLAGSALVRPLLGESLSFLLVERAERQVLGPLYQSTDTKAIKGCLQPFIGSKSIISK